MGRRRGRVDAGPGGPCRGPSLRHRDLPGAFRLEVALGADATGTDPGSIENHSAAWRPKLCLMLTCFLLFRAKGVFLSKKELRILTALRTIGKLRAGKTLIFWQVFKSLLPPPKHWGFHTKCSSEPSFPFDLLGGSNEAIFGHFCGSLEPWLSWRSAPSKTVLQICTGGYFRGTPGDEKELPLAGTKMVHIFRWHDNLYIII